MWIITCPECAHRAPLENFGPSCADEVTCPGCGYFFQWEAPPEEDDDPYFGLEDDDDASA
jgi:hypothetical protein